MRERVSIDLHARPEADEPRDSAVAAAFERFANQESDSAIRADLARALGKPTVSRGSLHAILKNPVYRGKVKYADDLHDGQHDSLVSEAVWRKVQARLAERRSQHFREPTHQPFTNVLRCGRCGRRMRFQTSAPAGYAAYTFFTCRTKGCPAIPAATFEASFALFLAAAEGAIRELLDDPAYGVPRSSGPTLEEATEAEKGAQTRLTHLSRLFADNPDDAELAARYEQAKHERNAARSTVERIRGEARSYRDELTALRERIFAVLVSNDPEERCDRVAAAFAKLEADEPNPVLPLIAAWSAASWTPARRSWRRASSASTSSTTTRGHVPHRRPRAGRVAVPLPDQAPPLRRNDPEA